MRLVALSQGKDIFKLGATRDRLASHGSIVSHLTVIVFGTGEPRQENIALNVTVIAPGGRTILSAYRQGMDALFRAAKGATLLTAQDPFFLGFAGVLASRKFHLPLQIQAHTDFFALGFIFESPRRMLEALLARFVLQKATCVRAVSERVAKGIRGITRVPVAVFPLRASIPQNAPKPTLFRQRFTVLSVSRLTHEKQVHVLIDAMRHVPEADLIIVGDGPLRGSLEARVRRLQLGERVRFAGEQKDVGAYYADANAYAQCSRYEGYGLSLLEAALAGLPIITTDVGIIGELLHSEEEALVVAASADSFAQALRSLIEDPRRAEELDARAKACAERTLISENAYLSKYKEILLTCMD